MGAFICIGQWHWGTGSTEEEAIENCRKSGSSRKFALYYSPTLDCEKNQVYVNQGGMICWRGEDSDEPKYYAKLVGRKYSIMHPDRAPKDESN